jgi:hypothetical protein
MLCDKGNKIIGIDKIVGIGGVGIGDRGLVVYLHYG